MKGSWQRSACTAAGWVSCSPRGTRLGHRALGMGILNKEGQTAARSGPLVPSPLPPSCPKTHLWRHKKEDAAVEGILIHHLLLGWGGVDLHEEP